MINKNIDNLIEEIQVPTGVKVAAAGYVLGGGPVGAAAAYGLYRAYNELKEKYNNAKDVILKQKIKVQMDQTKLKIEQAEDKEKDKDK